AERPCREEDQHRHEEHEAREAAPGAGGKSGVVFRHGLDFRFGWLSGAGDATARIACISNRVGTLGAASLRVVSPTDPVVVSVATGSSTRIPSATSGPTTPREMIQTASVVRVYCRPNARETVSIVSGRDAIPFAISSRSTIGRMIEP